MDRQQQRGPRLGVWPLSDRSSVVSIVPPLGRGRFGSAAATRSGARTVACLDDEARAGRPLASRVDHEQGCRGRNDRCLRMLVESGQRDWLAPALSRACMVLVTLRTAAAISSRQKGSRYQSAAWCSSDRRHLTTRLQLRERRSVDEVVEIAEPLLLLAVAVGQRCDVGRVHDHFVMPQNFIGCDRRSVCGWVDRGMVRALVIPTRLRVERHRWSFRSGERSR